MARPDYCRFMPTKWRCSALGLTLEQEGLLIRISAFNMEIGAPVPACRTTAARMMGCHRNKLNKLLDALVELGEITEDETGIYSPRAIEEFHRAEQQVTREKPKGNPRATPDIPKGNPIDTPPVEGEKSEQFLRAIVREDKIREERQTDRPVSVSARESDRPFDSDQVECKSAFNGSTGAMVAEVVAAMPGYGNDRGATQWLANLLRINGAEPVAQAFAMLQTAKAEGQPIARPLSWWSKTASTLKAQGVTAAKPKGPKRATLAESEAFIRDRQLAAFEAFGIPLTGFVAAEFAAQNGGTGQAQHDLPAVLAPAQTGQPAKTLSGGVGR